METVPRERVLRLRSLTAELHRALCGAAEMRPKRSVLHFDPLNGAEPEWAAAERSLMWQSVNAERNRHGLPAIGDELVRRAESLACGHVDYGSKWSFYCAEIALGMGHWFQDPS